MNEATTFDAAESLPHTLGLGLSRSCWLQELGVTQCMLASFSLVHPDGIRLRSHYAATTGLEPCEVRPSRVQGIDMLQVECGVKHSGIEIRQALLGALVRFGPRLTGYSAGVRPRP